MYESEPMDSTSAEPVSREEALDLDMDGAEEEEEEGGEGDSGRCSPGIVDDDEALEARFRERVRALYYDFPASPRRTTTTTTTPVVGDVAVNGDDDDHGIIGPSGRTADHDDEDEVAGYDFRLFAAGSNVQTGTSSSSNGNAVVVRRIAIRSPTPITSSRDSGFVVPRRPDGYYFAGPLAGVRAEQIAAAAISGEEVIDGLLKKLRWRGCELPWRVIVIQSSASSSSKSATSSSKNGGGSQPASTSSNGKRRIGKKRRIAIRKKVQAIEEKKIAAKRNQVEKEAAGKEKRTRRNREKKVKKKQKEKMQKMMMGAQEVQTAAG